MAERIDAHLSGKAQSADPSAVVVCVDWPENDSGERWVLRRNAAPGQLAEVELGDRFDIAEEAVLVWARHERASRNV